MQRLTKMLMAATAAAGLFAAPVWAQGKPLPRQPQPTHAQQGEAGPAIPPAAPAAGTITPQAYYPYGGGQPALYTAIPVTVASDGRVYANFGAGYTWVPQQCSAQRLAQLGVRTGPVQYQAVQPQIAPVQPGVVAPPTINGTSSTQQANAPCWSQASNGVVAVYR